MDKLAGQTVPMTGRNDIAGNGNGNGNRTGDDVADRYYLEVLAMYKPLLTEYQQALETANPKANVCIAEATKSFYRHLERLSENKWMNEEHSLATLQTEIHATIEEWWDDFMKDVFSDDQNAPNEGATDSAESGDDEGVLKQPLGMGSKESNANAKQNPATDSDAAKDNENSAKKKAATQGNGAKKAQGKSSLEKQAHAMAEKVAYEVAKALTPKKTDVSSDLAAKLIQISLVPGYQRAPRATL
jgi:hypothetical protein